MAARIPLELVDGARPIAISEYHRMLETGILDADERIELLEGVIVTMPPCAPGHAHAIEVLNRALVRAAGDDLRVRPQLPLTLAPRSEPEPDLAVVRQGGALAARHPESALLVVEVADSSARIDRGPKAALYARAAIPEYWIVDVSRQRVEVLTDPDPAAGEYRTRRTLGASDTLETALIPALTVAVHTLFAV